MYPPDPARRSNVIGNIFEPYGGKRAALIYLLHKIAYRLGNFNRYHRIDFKRVERLVFVCKGNICRSPYAEVRARLIVSSHPVTSFGLEASTGQPANSRALTVSRSRGVDMNIHAARIADEVTVMSSDLLVAMEPWQAIALDKYSKTPGAQVTLLGIWGRPIRPNIPDPYGCSEKTFQSCFDSIDDALSRLCKRLV